MLMMPKMCRRQTVS